MELNVPPIGNGQGVLVLHDWWGLNDALGMMQQIDAIP